MCIPVRESEGIVQNRQISEAVLAAIWNEQAPLRGPMWDCEGKPVAVVYRGRWSAGSGPDFEDAMLSLGEGGALVAGSVEMHLRCSDWWAHGHSSDPRYNSVALHVVLWPVGARPVTREDGATVPTLVLADYITAPTVELLDRVTPLISNLGALSEEPCWQRTQTWPIERLLSAIDEAGDARLLSKAGKMEAGLSSTTVEEVFYRGLMDALGYPANREPMGLLAELLPISQLLTLPLSRKEEERVTLLEAILLGAGGFLLSQRPLVDQLDWLSTQYADELEALWLANAPLLGLVPNEGIVDGWITERVRPANSPQRRLAGAAHLLARLLWSGDALPGVFLTNTGLTPMVTAKDWRSLLIVCGEGYWAMHSDFGQALHARREETAIIGQERAADIVVNVVLPLLLAYADHNSDEALREKVLAVYAVFPRLAENRITTMMADEALGPRKRGSINGARRQQGLIHLYRLYCHDRACYACPLSGARQGYNL